jgi:hypothetical protein
MTALRRSEEAAGGEAVCDMIVGNDGLRFGGITLGPPKLKEKIQFWGPYLCKEQTWVNGY